ncbi:MAG TPA: hypothetical protein VE685_12780 [Thermoanaerobaculia bacterium]|nr:hypothetical protein [Thermoanaerobaculia bacterium]
MAKPLILLFTGHMIDAPSREEARFPPDKEEVAREAIRTAILEERTLAPVAYGIAGGASGGDILFHEICAGLGIPTRLYLALPRDQYIVHSVQPAGAGWVERFDRLYRRHPQARVLSGSETEDVWQRTNLWMLQSALADEDKDLTLIAIWDGKDQGDGSGGTGDLVRQAQERGARTVILETTELFGIG